MYFKNIFYYDRISLETEDGSMIFFKKRKFRKQKKQETNDKMKDLFEKKVKDNEDYKLLYAYTEILEPDGYDYQSKIVGYRESDMSIIIIDTDKDFKKSSHIHKFIKGEFEKASYSKGDDLYMIQKTNSKSDKITFTIVLKNYEDEDLLAITEQEIEKEEFYDFFMEFKKKPHLRKNTKK